MKLLLPLLCALGASAFFQPSHADSPTSFSAPASPSSPAALVPAAATPAARTHVMWKCVDGTVSLWTVGDDGSVAYKQYGPYSGWTATSLADGADGVTALIWTRTSDGKISLWKLDSAGNPLSTEYGPFPGWSAVALSRSAPGAGALTGAAGGDLLGFYPNPTIAPNAIDHTKLASDFGSLGQVSGGLLYTPDNWHTMVQHDLQVHGTVITLDGNGGGSGNNGKVARALVDGGSASNLIINYANDFGRVSVQSELDVHGALGLEPGDIYANNDINIHKNTNIHGDFGVDGVVNLGSGTINSANDININKNATVTGHFGVNGPIDASGYISTKSTMYANSLQLTGGSDLAEPYKIAASADVQPLPGMVVAIDPSQTGQMRVSTQAYDTTVGGIISGAGGVHPGITLRQTGTVADGTLPIACTGRVWCWCDAGDGAITPGDLLTTSDTPGHAMRVRDYDRARGAIIGKAMSPLKTGKGLVLVLVTLQ